MSVKINSQEITKDIYEHTVHQRNAHVMGVDEAGRGCLAGPVVAAAVVLPHEISYHEFIDSKLLSAQARAATYRWLLQHAWIGVGIVPPTCVDELNIYHASACAMHRAITHALVNAPTTTDTILIDAMPLDHHHAVSQMYHMFHGEHVSSSIAAASIYAKHYRDHIMQQMDRMFPIYQLGRHKGYATQQHKAHVRSWGDSLMHRTSFTHKVHTQQQRCYVQENKGNKERDNEQLSIC